MVGFNHDHDDDEPCPGCVAALQAAIEVDIADGGAEFDQGFGDLIDSMCIALGALSRTRRGQSIAVHGEIANTHEAATELVRASALIREAIARGIELRDPLDDEQ